MLHNSEIKIPVRIVSAFFTGRNTIPIVQLSPLLSASQIKPFLFPLTGCPAEQWKENYCAGCPQAVLHSVHVLWWTVYVPVESRTKWNENTLKTKQTRTTKKKTNPNNTFFYSLYSFWQQQNTPYPKLLAFLTETEQWYCRFGWERNFESTEDCMQFLIPSRVISQKTAWWANVEGSKVSEVKKCVK